MCSPKTTTDSGAEQHSSCRARPIAPSCTSAIADADEAIAKISSHSSMLRSLRAELGSRIAPVKLVGARRTGASAVRPVASSCHSRPRRRSRSTMSMASRRMSALIVSSTLAAGTSGRSVTSIVVSVTRSTARSGRGPAGCPGRSRRGRWTPDVIARLRPLVAERRTPRRSRTATSSTTSQTTRRRRARRRSSSISSSK